MSATQPRTAALVILTSGVVPNLGNTRTFNVISSRVRVVNLRSWRVLIHSCYPCFWPDLAAPRVAPQSIGEVELYFRLPTFRVNQTPLGLAVRPAGGIAVADLVSNHRLDPPGLVPLLKLAAFDIGHRHQPRRSR